MNPLHLDEKNFAPAVQCMLISAAAGDPPQGVIFKAASGGGRVVAEEIYKSDEFRMYAYKIKRCPRTRSHDWTECPYAHRGEKAQRRDPRRFRYCAIACPAFRNGSCPKGDTCDYAHGVFEYWLHPARYRTRSCNAGKYCERKVCFFAHSPEQLRPETNYRCRYAYRPTTTMPVASSDTPAVEEGRNAASSGEKLSTIQGVVKEDDGGVLINSFSDNLVFEHQLPEDSELLHLGWITELVN